MSTFINKIQLPITVYCPCSVHKEVQEYLLKMGIKWKFGGVFYSKVIENLPMKNTIYFDIHEDITMTRSFTKARYKKIPFDVFINQSEMEKIKEKPKKDDIFNRNLVF